MDLNHFFGDHADLAQLQEEDLPFTEQQLSAIIRQAVQAELQTVGDPTRSAVYNLARRAVADEFSTVGSRTRQALIELLEGEIRSPTGDLHQALLAVLAAANLQEE